jgi:hypothetical protein
MCALKSRRQSNDRELKRQRCKKLHRNEKHTAFVEKKFRTLHTNDLACHNVVVVNTKAVELAPGIKLNDKHKYFMQLMTVLLF